MEPRELQVSVAWGHIAIKAWGDAKNEIVIVLHGFLDNAASFDRLIPLLPQHFYYLCVDFPGHGLSSHFPPALPLYVISYIQVIRIVVDHFKRKKYILLAHSLGGRLAATFTQVFPDVVSKLIVLDAGYAIPSSPQEYILWLRESHETLVKIASNTPNRSFTRDEIIQKIRDGRLAGRLTFEAAEQLSQRMIKKVDDDKYELTFDRRLLSIVYPPYNMEYISELLNQYPITCPALSVYATETQEMIAGHTGYTGFFHVPNFEVIEVAGHHHSHHTNPEIFASILSRFLLENKSKL